LTSSPIVGFQILGCDQFDQGVTKQRWVLAVGETPSHFIEISRGCFAQTRCHHSTAFDRGSDPFHFENRTLRAITYVSKFIFAWALGRVFPRFPQLPEVNAEFSKRY
jgi:hypothetical protein